MKMLPTWKIHTSATFLQAVLESENPSDKINHQRLKKKKNTFALQYFQIPLNSYVDK